MSYATHYSFFHKRESNLKPDSQLYSRNRFSPAARMVDLLLLNGKKTDFDCAIKNLVLNVSLIYRKMNRELHDIPRFRLSDTGMEKFPSKPISLSQQLSYRDVTCWFYGQKFRFTVRREP